jgi:hypothetical protein
MLSVTLDNTSPNLNFIYIFHTPFTKEKKNKLAYAFVIFLRPTHVRQSRFTHVKQLRPVHLAWIFFGHFFPLEYLKPRWGEEEDI